MRNKYTLTASIQPCFRRLQFSSVTSHVRIFTPIKCSKLGFLSITNSGSLLKLVFIESVMPSSHPILFSCFNLSQDQGLFQWVSSSHQVARVLELQLYHSSNKYSRLISLGLTDLMSFLSNGLSRVFSNITVQKYKFFGVQPLFMVQLSHPYMTTGQTIALTRQNLLVNSAFAF